MLPGSSIPSRPIDRRTPALERISTDTTSNPQDTGIVLTGGQPWAGSIYRSRPFYQPRPFYAPRPFYQLRSYGPPIGGPPYRYPYGYAYNSFGPVYGGYGFATIPPSSPVLTETIADSPNGSNVIEPETTEIPAPQGIESTVVPDSSIGQVFLVGPEYQLSAGHYPYAIPDQSGTTGPLTAPGFMGYGHPGLGVPGYYYSGYGYPTYGSPVMGYRPWGVPGSGYGWGYWGYGGMGWAGAWLNSPLAGGFWSGTYHGWPGTGFVAP